MKMNKVQKKKPTRTCTRTYSHYRSFKPYLRDDFNQRCGYCDDQDCYAGGTRGCHIDHFKPHSIKEFKSLKESYSNLVYSCPYCNGVKSNKWKDTNGFVDPCENEYDNHLKRNDIGEIIYETDQGQYIYLNLNLGLKRHELLWCIDKLKQQKQMVSLKMTKCINVKSKELEILRAFKEIQDKIDEYTEFFEEEI